MIFDMSNATDIEIMASMVAAFRRERVEFVIERVITHGAGGERTAIKLIV